MQVVHAYSKRYQDRLGVPAEHFKYMLELIDAKEMFWTRITESSYTFTTTFSVTPYICIYKLRNY